MRGVIDVAIALIRQNGRCLISRRAADLPLGGLWEFPGGKCLPGESPEKCVVREVREETALDVQVEKKLAEIPYQYDGGPPLRLHFFLCRVVSGDPRSATESRWVPAEDLPHYPFPEANAALIRQISSGSLSAR